LFNIHFLLLLLGQTGKNGHLKLIGAVVVAAAAAAAATPMISQK